MGQSCSNTTPLPTDEQVAGYRPDVPADPATADPTTGDPTDPADSTDQSSSQTGTPPAPRTLSITASTYSGKAPLAVAFTAGTVEGGKVPTGLSWDLGDGTTKSSSRAQYVYNTPGIYTVRLCPGATTPYPETLTCAQVFIAVLEKTSSTSGTTTTVLPKTLKITASRWTGVAPYTISFAASVVEGGIAPTGLVWNFGDGATATGNRPKHTYSTAGTFTVTLCPGPTTPNPSLVTCAQGVVRIGEMGTTDPGAADPPGDPGTGTDPDLGTDTGGTDPGTGGTDSGTGGTDTGGGTPRVNHAPVPVSRGFRISSVSNTPFNLGGSDPDNDPLTYLIVAIPSSGALSFGGRRIGPGDLPYTIPNGSNLIVYEPANGYEGRDEFTYAVSDGELSADAVYFLTTSPVVTAPPAITSARWTNVPAVPQPGTVTRADYYDYIRRWYLDRALYTRTVANNPQVRQEDFALYEAFMYATTGDNDYARWTMKFIQGTYNYYTTGAGKADVVRFDAVVPLAQAWNFIRNSPVLTAEDHALARATLLLADQRQGQGEYGAFSRAVATAVSRKMVSQLYPDDAGNASRVSYTNQVWNDWWTAKDGSENSTNYCANYFKFLVPFISVYASDTSYSDAALRTLADRYMNQAMPFGLMAEYGDGVGPNANPGMWISYFEKMATVYRDGRYKWLAHRIFEWTHARESDMLYWGNIYYYTMVDLMQGYLVADDTIAEVAPSTGSLVTTRKAMRWAGAGDPPNYPNFLLANSIPDKLILRSGWNQSDMFALVELAPQMGHGHYDTASINALAAGGSALLGPPAYLHKEQEFHNCFQVYNATGNGTWTRAGKPEVATSVPVLKTGSLGTYAQVHVDGYNYSPSNLDRRIWFVNNSFVWVRDTLTATATLNATVGPSYNTVAAYGASGTNWMNTCLVTLPCAPVYNSQYLLQWKNQPHDLLVKFLPDNVSQMQVDDVTWNNLNIYAQQPLLNTMKLRLWYRRNVQLAAGASVTSSSLLIPHAPEADSTARAAAYNAVLDAGGSSVIRVDQAGGSSLYVGINDAGNSITAGPISTNARWFVVEVLNNAPTRYWVIEGTQLSVNGTPAWSSAQRADGQFGT